MKKLKTLLLTITASFILIIYVVEPISLNPFHEVSYGKAVTKGQLTSLDQNCSLEKEINELLSQRVEHSDFLGVTTGIYKQNCGMFLSAAGYMDKGKNIMIKPNSIGRIASVTKPMTAVAIMQLYERNLIELDLPIKQYIHEFKSKELGEVTIRQLLSHTSGIPHYSSKYEALSFTNYSSMSETISYIGTKDLVFEPGSRYLYSSYG